LHRLSTFAVSGLMSDDTPSNRPSFEHDHEHAEAAFDAAKRDLRKVSDAGFMFTVLRSGRVAKHCFGRTHAERVNMVCLCLQELIYDLTEQTMDALDDKDENK